ncbi:MAG: hypothetical protein AB1489_07095 [Acidobacteriota bacterium]
MRRKWILVLVFSLAMLLISNVTETLACCAAPRSQAIAAYSDSPTNPLITLYLSEAAESTIDNIPGNLFLKTDEELVALSIISRESQLGRPVLNLKPVTELRPYTSYELVLLDGGTTTSYIPLQLVTGVGRDDLAPSALGLPQSIEWRHTSTTAGTIMNFEFRFNETPDNDGVSRYRIYLATSKNNYQAHNFIGSFTTINYSDRAQLGLWTCDGGNFQPVAGQTYYVGVTAIDDAGNESVCPAIPFIITTPSLDEFGSQEIAVRTEERAVRTATLPRYVCGNVLSAQSMVKPAPVNEPVNSNANIPPATLISLIIIALHIVVGLIHTWLKNRKKES